LGPLEVNTIMDGESGWRSDWTSFVVYVARLRGQRLTDFEINNLVGGQQVMWIGTIETMRLGNEEYARGLQMRMPMASAPADGWTVVGSFLALSVNSADEPAWRAFSIGDQVIFEGTISTGDGPFAGVSFVEDETDHEARLSLEVVGGIRPKRPDPADPTQDRPRK
jgi:hypothetical protein